MPITKVKDNFLSAQWGSFLEEAVIHQDHAREIYEKNINDERSRNGRRKAIAIAENIPASISLILIVTALDGAINTTSFRKKISDYNQWDSLSKKVVSLTSQPGTGKLKQILNELTFARDSIIHGWVWQKTRRFNDDFSTKFIRSYLWKPYRIRPGKKFKSIVNFCNRTTDKIKLSIIPTDINFVDSLISLIIVEKIIDLLGYKNIVPRLYTSKNRGFTQKTAQITPDNNFCTLESWINYFEKSLDQKHDKKILENLKSII